MQQGLSLHQDWTVLLGTLYLCDSNAQLVKDVFRRFPNYDEQKTCNNIEKLGGRYFPATFGYLYRIYGMDIENSLDENETSLHYLLRRCGLEQNLLAQFEEMNEEKAISDIHITVNKEKNYLKENDEVADVSVWNRLCDLKQYDLYFYDDLIKSVVKGEDLKYTPTGFKVFERIESLEKRRILVSLSAKDRVITTNLALRLCSLMKSSWKSFSYHISYTSQVHIFYYWYSSWGKFIDHIRVFTEIPFMDDYEVFYTLSQTLEQLIEITIKDVIEKNACIIEVHGYYGTEEGKKAIESFLQEQGIEGETVTYEKEIVNHASQVADYAKRIWPKSYIRDNVYTVVREFNMTKGNVFPDEMLSDPKKAICMFVKKREIIKTEI